MEELQERRKFFSGAGFYFLLIAYLTIFSSCGEEDKKVEISGNIYMFIGSGQYYIYKSNGAIIDKDSSGKILFSKEMYKRIKNVKNQRYKDMYQRAMKNREINKYFSDKHFIIDLTGEYGMPLYDPYIHGPSGSPFTVNSDPIKKIFNFRKGDSLMVRTSFLGGDLGAIRYDWSPDGKWLAISSADSIETVEHKSVLLINLVTQEIKRYYIGMVVGSISWSPSSFSVAVLSYISVPDNNNIFNFIINLFGRPFERMVHDLTIIDVTTGNKATIPIKRESETFIFDIYWIE